MLASACRMKRRKKSGQASMGEEVRECLRIRNAVSSFFPHCHVASWRVKRVKGAATVAKSGVNRRYHDVRPMNRRTCLMFVGVDHYVTARTLSGSVRISCLSMICLEYFKLFAQKRHFSGFSFSRASRTCRNTSARCHRCSVNVALTIIMSSWYANTFSSSSGPNTLSSNHWNMAVTECSPNGMIVNCMSP